MSLDPGAIAFVDAAILKTLKKNPAIKVLKIGKVGTGTGVTTAGASPHFPLPTAKNIMSGSYPISQRLTLYISPKASDTTKDFVKFLLSGQCDEAFHKNALFPAP